MPADTSTLPQKSRPLTPGAIFEHHELFLLFCATRLISTQPRATITTACLPRPPLSQKRPHCPLSPPRAESPCKRPPQPCTTPLSPSAACAALAKFPLGSPWGAENGSLMRWCWPTSKCKKLQKPASGTSPHLNRASCRSSSLR